MRTTSKVTAMCLALTICLTGCGGESQPKTFRVSGVVKHKQKAVSDAQVVFVPETQSTQPAVATTDSDGRYAMTTFVNGDGAIPGKYSVKVFKFKKGTGPVDPNASPMTFEEEQKLPSTIEKPAPPAKNLLPVKYADHLTSGLSHTVGDSPSTFDIELK